MEGVMGIGVDWVERWDWVFGLTGWGVEEGLGGRRRFSERRKAHHGDLETRRPGTTFTGTTKRHH